MKPYINSTPSNSPRPADISLNSNSIVEMSLHLPASETESDIILSDSNEKKKKEPPVDSFQPPKKCSKSLDLTELNPQSADVGLDETLVEHNQLLITNNQTNNSFHTIEPSAVSSSSYASELAEIKLLVLRLTFLIFFMI